MQNLLWLHPTCITINQGSFLVISISSTLYHQCSPTYLTFLIVSIKFYHAVPSFVLLYWVLSCCAEFCFAVLSFIMVCWVLVWLCWVFLCCAKFCHPVLCQSKGSELLPIATSHKMYNTGCPTVSQSMQQEHQYKISHTNFHCTLHYCCSLTSNTWNFSLLSFQ